KYLLNIPYPHPPVFRFIVGITRGLPGQEMFWRITLATVLLQAVWLVVSFLPEDRKSERFALGALWILSAAVLVQAGQILVAPVTALQALVFCWLLLKGRDLERYVGWIALLWLASLFTAYQAILYLPIVLVVFWRMQLPFWKRAVAFLLPIFLLGLYSLGHPLALSSMITAGEQNISAGRPTDALRGVLFLWAVGGSVVLSLLGTFGMFSARRWPLVGSLFLLSIFLFLSYRPYYGILFTPLFIAGVAASPRMVRFVGLSVVLTLFCAAFIVPHVLPPPEPSSARIVLRTLAANRVSEGMILIAGSFGHEWQYESPMTVQRYNPRLIDSARAVICLADCPEVRWRERWRILPGLPIEVWMRTLEAWRK
ncbi:MAG: hypothetical protein PHS73_01050, partial [Candidatus Peribacteraceae bacterium]|nr:hypothetical protein [Candidatus Peribacteraceae bacterium]